MRGNEFGLSVLWDVRASNDEWDVDVFLKGILLAGPKAMVTKVETVVRAIDDVRIIQLVSLVEDIYNVFDNIID
jgi:hypothetical protein